jgi:photosystem II stability/assembly factor-like uncharacterized protein
MKSTLFAIITLFILLLFQNSYVSAQWVALGGALGGDVDAVASINSNLYACGSAYLFRSTNNGDNWAGLHPDHVSAIVQSSSNIFCGVWETNMSQTAGVYRSTNNGVNWTLIGLNNQIIFDVAANNQQIIASSILNSKVYSSTNQGLNWTDITGDLTYGVQKVAISNGMIYGGGQGLHVTTNNGIHWSTLFLSDNTDAFIVSDSTIFIGTYSHGVYRSTNSGQSWEQTLNVSKRIYSLYRYGSNIFVGGDTCFYVSTDGGSTFTDKRQGLGNATISGIVVQNNYVFVVNSNYLSTNVSGWKRPLQELIGINNISSEIPGDYTLYQNYPNPFNPSTKIKFSVTSVGAYRNTPVQLTVYDLLGQEVAVLVNEQLKPGTYEVDWDASNYPSGVYFYRMTVNDASTSLSFTKRMVLLK